jgi:hypothetical protein
MQTLQTQTLGKVKFTWDVVTLDGAHCGDNTFLKKSELREI